MKHSIQKLSTGLLLLTGVCQAMATVLLSDNFDNNSIDPAKWTTNTTWDTTGHSTPRVSAVNQRIEFIERGYLNTVTNYDPAASGGLLISGTWTIIYNNANAGDAPTVATRSSGIPLPYPGEVSDGIRFKLQPPQNNYQPLILGTGGATVTGYNQISNTLSLVSGDTVNFTITDDGTNLTFFVAKVGNPASAGYATAVSTSQLTTNLISFYNREVSSDSSALDNVFVSILSPPAPTDFNFTTNNGAITITGYAGSGGSVIIPDTINGYPVTDIAAGAYGFSSGVTSVTIGTNLTSIGFEVFNQCPSLTAINVNTNNSAYSSVNGALLDKNQTTLIVCPGGLTGNYVIPNTVTTISVLAFQKCANLTGVTIGTNVTSIGANAFTFCYGLTNIIIPNSVTSIGYQQFSFCSSLTSATIGTNVTSIGDYMFNYCPKLSSVIIPNSVTSIGNYSFQYCSGLTNIVIPNSVTGIGSSAFEGCGNMLSITIPNGLTSIASGAFEGCFSLSNITIPNSVNNIGSVAFGYCTSLTGVYFQGNSPTPTNDITVFSADTNAVAYYLPGTIGWGDAFDGIPTSIILPPAPAVGISTYGGQPAVFFPTAAGTNFVLQMTTNLTPPVNWVTVSNGVPISGIIVTNPSSAAFYRLH